MTRMTGDEILELMRTEFPTVERMGLKIDDLHEDAINVRWPEAARHVRPGGTISGPAMMALADTAAYFLVLANAGPQVLAVTTSLNINFLRKPSPGLLFAKGRTLKRGSRLVVTEVSIHTGTPDDPPVAHSTVTYSIPPKRRS